LEGQIHFYWGGKIFVFIICLKQIFLSTTKFGAAQKRFGGNCLRMPYCVCGPGQNRRQKVFHWGPSCLCRGLAIAELESGHNFSTRPEPDPCCPKPDPNPTSEIKTRFGPENFLTTVGYVQIWSPGF